MGTSINPSSIAQHTVAPIPIGDFFKPRTPKAEPSAPEVKTPPSVRVLLSKDQVKQLNPSWRGTANEGTQSTLDQFDSVLSSLTSKDLISVHQPNGCNSSYGLLKKALQIAPGVSIPVGSRVSGNLSFGNGCPVHQSSLALDKPLNFVLPDKTEITFTPGMDISSGMGTTIIAVKDPQTGKSSSRALTGALFFNDTNKSLAILAIDYSNQQQYIYRPIQLPKPN